MQKTTKTQPSQQLCAHMSVIIIAHHNTAPLIIQIISTAEMLFSGGDGVCGCGS